MKVSVEKYSYIAGVLLLGLISCTPQPQSSEPKVQPAMETAAPEPPLDSRDTIAGAEGDIWSQLQQADTRYYVLMRHALAPGTGDPANFQVDDCSTQRNLSEEGRAQARRTGAAFREKNVTVERVLSSEWCRCLETAELMDLGPVEQFPVLNSFFQDRAQGPGQTQRLREFMVDNRDEPGVTVMVTHFVNIGAIANSGVSSGALVVMQVNKQNEPEVVAQIDQF